MYNNLSLIKPKPGIQLNRAHPLAQGLAACWLINEGSGTATRDTISGRSGTLTNFALAGSSTSGWVGSRFGGGLRFDGSDDYIATSVSNIVTSEITILVWVNISAFTLYDGIVVQREGTSAKTIYLGIRETGRLAIFIDTNGSGNANHDNFGSVLNGNQWLQIGFTFSAVSNALVTYVNGAVNSTATGTISGGLLPSIADSWEFGNDKGAAGRYLSGVIDHIRIYNRVLSQGDVRTLLATPFIDFHGSKTKLLIK